MDKVTEKEIGKFLDDMELTFHVQHTEDEKKRLFDIWCNALENVSLIQFIRAKKRLLAEWNGYKFPKPADLKAKIDDSEGVPLTEFPEPFKITAEIEQKRNSFFDKQRENGVMSPKKGE